MPGKPVALVYGHYDVQPPEPLDEWISPPFEPTVRDGNIYARGATDDKGQMLTHVKSVEAWIKVGRQAAAASEVSDRRRRGSRQRAPRAVSSKANREKLACDCDRHQRLQPVRARHAGDHLRPARHRVLRAAAARAASRICTPARSAAASRTRPTRWSTLLAALKDKDGRIQVPGFYDDVVPLTDRERAEFRALPLTDDAVHGAARRRRPVRRERASRRSSAAGRGRRATSTASRAAIRAKGRRRCCRREASAKFSFRLVPNQDPKKIAASLRKFLEERLPPGIEMELIDHHGAPGVVVPLDSPYMRAAAAAIEAGFGRAPVFIREGGSIPIVNTFARRARRRRAAPGLGPERRQHAQPERKVLARRLPPRHAGQRMLVGRIGEGCAKRTRQKN